MKKLNRIEKEQAMNQTSGWRTSHFDFEQNQFDVKYKTNLFMYRLSGNAVQSDLPLLASLSNFLLRTVLLIPEIPILIQFHHHI